MARSGFVLQYAPKAGIVQWEMPREDGRTYLEVMDPGQGNPPYRNAPVICVWDITGFPKSAATMRAFWWGFGNGSYEPCKAQFRHYYQAYKPSWGVFDSTGTQKGFEELFNAENSMMIYGISLAAGVKGEALLSLKWIMGRGLLRWPASIQGIYRQLLQYEMPDTKLIQDIVMTFAMSAFFMKRFYYVDMEDETRPVDETENVSGGRHDRAQPDRNERSTSR